MVFKVIKVLLSLAALGAFVWFSFTVNLGDRTFFGHVRAIASSRESQQLVSGAKERAGELLSGKGEPTEKPKAESVRVVKPERNLVDTHPAAPPQEDLRETDRQDMRRLLEARGAKSGK